PLDPLVGAVDGGGGGSRRARRGAPRLSLASRRSALGRTSPGVAHGRVSRHVVADRTIARIASVFRGRGDGPRLHRSLGRISRSGRAVAVAVAPERPVAQGRAGGARQPSRCAVAGAPRGPARPRALSPLGPHAGVSSRVVAAAYASHRAHATAR